MNRANYSKGRAIGLPVLVVLTGLVWIAPAMAQVADSPAPPSQAVDAPTSRSSLTLDSEIARAEALFHVGDLLLSAGHEFEAREAFDSALDTFVNLKGPAAADPRFLPAYEGLISRIHAAEVAAGAERRSLQDSMTPPRPQANAQAPPAVLVEPPVENTLADLGNRIEALTPTADARLSNEAVLGAEVIDLPIELNDQVLGAIDLYSGKFRNWFSRALSRGVPHLPRIREIFAAAGIPQDLAYVPIVESAFNPSALSSAKARGLWQFIPSTGRQYGLKLDFFVDERSDMEMATAAAAQYLKRLYEMFGDWNLALAGYNAGEGTVMRAIRRANTNDFWALAKTRSFRSETKNYVPLIHAAIMIAKSPESYGIEISPSENALVETVRVAGSYPITTVARCAKAEPTEIRQMNPELRRGLTPSSAFDLKVPQGSAEEVSACLASERALNYTRHVVRKRDTLSLLSKMFGVPAAEIARVNGLTLNSRLKPGTELAVPRPTARATAAAPATHGRASAEGSDASYTIRKGDTLSAVAARHSTTVDAIKALNGLSTSRLSIGQVLRVSSSSASENNPPD